QESTHRRFVADLLANSALAKAEVRVGFGLDESNQHFPSSENIGSLVDGLDPTVIWKTVVLRHASGIARVTTPIDHEPWGAACRWVDTNRGVSDALLTECDQALVDRGEVLLVLFDALDRLATDWTRARSLISGALQFALTCRSRKALRLKFFLRPDME